MGKSRPFKKAKNNGEAGSSKSKKKECSRVYVKVELAWLLYNNNASAGWDDVHLPDG
jgi:hypothetical protein